MTASLEEALISVWRQALVEDAHKICPYSRATRGNVPVTLTVV